MSKHENVEAVVEKMVLPILEENKLTLVDTEYLKEAGQYYLRITIDKTEGVNIQDCETVSRALSLLLDENDPTDEAYILEVQSPGLGRGIKKEKDYERNIGRDVDLKLFREENGQKELTGTLKEFNKENITVITGDREIVIERKNIAKISEYVDWSLEK